MRTSQFGTVVTSTAPDRTYGLAQFYGDLSTGECNLCYDVASSSLPGCLPSNGGRVYLTGCFMRYENYSFFEEHTGQEDRVICVNKTMRNNAFEQSASKAVFQTVKNAPKSKEYNAGKQALISGTENKSVYAMADCWRTLDTDSCSDDTQLLMMVNNSNLNFKYSIIEKATGSFDEVNKLGQGGFGTVYKGVLPDGREIAAKRLFFNQRHRTGDFYHEVNIISSVDHKNLVKLVGFSCLGPESILIYEYLPNKSLNYFIFDAVRGKELNWAKRFDIIVGIAEGLAYLHENSKTRIIHRDIKVANILLDSRLRAKIADFGLARSFQEDKNRISTGIAGTLGYMAPEYVLNGKLTEKVDVYSVGVLLLEVITGIPNRGTQTSDDTHSLLTITWRHFQQGTVDELFDPNLLLKDDTSSSMKKEIRSVIQIGLLCTQEVPSLRPTMSMTLQMLSKNIVPLPSLNRHRIK
ncbi:unnamed protein product [Lactuca saligna]|uniref:Cysteine-rich receptor-like protein kinase 2 n=1 Tax=Lactuca saligna TaxID=75948 RepID=A0AA35VB27_LACSI|nr:unnamed protein product [Lactuca saligna]